MGLYRAWTIHVGKKAKEEEIVEAFVCAAQFLKFKISFRWEMILRGS
jgi:hypothetical protein